MEFETCPVSSAEIKKEKKVNKRGFTMIELIGAMVIIAILTVAGITAIATAISNSRMSATQTDLSGFQTPIEQFLLENPQMAKENDLAKIGAELNKYLEGEMQFKALPADTDSVDVAQGDQQIAQFEVKRNDAWDQPFRIAIVTDNHSATQGPSNAQDTELRIFVVSNGKNSTTGATDSAADGSNLLVDGDDDMFLMVQLVNGQVSHGMYGMRDGDSLFATANADTTTVKTEISGTGEGKYKENGNPSKGSIMDLSNVVLANTVNKAGA